jgi:murein DD-endopeptidase MepM/ murein hydrolase activator NlpD
LKHIDIVLDDAELVPLGPPPPTPFVIDSPEDVAGPPAATAPSGKIVTHIVQPGDTLFAIAQRYRADLAALYTLNGLNETSVLKIGQAIQVPLPVESAPTATPLPPTPVPIAVGTLCVSAFEDVAGDGRYGDGDRALTGAAFIVADTSGAAVATSSGARCFKALPVGAYAVLAQVPAGYLATTDTRWGVALTEAAQVDVMVGGRRVEESETEASSADGTQVVVFGTGIVVLIGLVAIVLRRRANHAE